MNKRYPYIGEKQERRDIKDIILKPHSLFVYTQIMRRPYGTPQTQSSGGGISMYTLMLALICFIIFVSITVAICLSLLLRPPGARFVSIITPAPAITTTTTVGPNTTVTTTVGTTTTMVTTAANTTVPPTTTPPVVFITCPPDVNVTLGASLWPVNTGGSANASGGCTTPLVIQYVDEFDNSIVNKRNSEMNRPSRWGTIEHLGIDIPGIHMGSEMEPEPIMLLKKRSASFDSPNAYVYGTPYVATNPGGAAVPYASSASSGTLVLNTLNGATGTVVNILNGTDTTFKSSFLLSSLAAVNSTCNVNVSSTTANFNITTGASGQVIWDNTTQRWFLAELASTNGTTVDTMCVYISTTADPLSTYHAFAYNFTVGVGLSFMRIGLWPSSFAITFNAINMTYNLCVLDRYTLLNFINVNSTIPPLFCGAPLNGPLPAFTVRQAWTPVTTGGGGALPPPSTEGAGAVNPAGAVFMRAIDDELQRGANTPLFDQIEVEHWNSINFTSSTYSALRYVVTVQNFDDSFAACPSVDSCIPTPNALVQLDPVREMISSDLSYTNILATGQESLVLTHTSFANGVNSSRIFWFEFRWAAPFWALYQQGIVVGPPGGSTNLWMGSAAMDSQGTITLGYGISSNTTYPSLQVVSRLANDPLGMMRMPINVGTGAVGSTFPNGQVWGPISSMVADPLRARSFYMTNMVSAITNPPWSVRTMRLRILGEVTTRIWWATDPCLVNATCQQVIYQT